MACQKSLRVALEAKPKRSGSASVISAVSEGIVVVEVGCALKKYYVHKALQTYHSEYFCKALQGQWQEAQDRVVQLTDVETSTFNLFVHWLYSQQVPYELEGDWERILQLEGDWERILQLEGNNNTTTTTIARLRTCIKVYAFADRMLAPVFLQRVNDRFVQFYTHYKEYLPTERYPIIGLAFETIALDRVILQFLVDRHCDTGFWDPAVAKQNKDNIQWAEDHLPRRFLFRVLKRLDELDSMTTGERYILRCYKEHTDDAPQGKCCAQHMSHYDALDFAFFN